MDEFSKGNTGYKQCNLLTICVKTANAIYTVLYKCYWSLHDYALLSLCNFDGRIYSTKNYPNNDIIIENFHHLA